MRSQRILVAGVILTLVVACGGSAPAPTTGGVRSTSPGVTIGPGGGASTPPPGGATVTFPPVPGA
jgi:hypothetical protein